MAQVSIFPGQESSDIPASPNIWFERNAYIEKGETLLEPVIIGCVSYEGPTAWHHTGFIRMLVNTKHPKGLLDIAAEQFDLANFCLTTDNWVGDGVID